jgi:hypothetical protein
MPGSRRGLAQCQRPRRSASLVEQRPALRSYARSGQHRERGDREAELESEWSVRRRIFQRRMNGSRRKDTVSGFGPATRALRTGGEALENGRKKPRWDRRTNDGFRISRKRSASATATRPVSCPFKGATTNYAAELQRAACELSGGTLCEPAATPKK